LVSSSAADIYSLPNVKQALKLATLKAHQFDNAKNNSKSWQTACTVEYADKQSQIEEKFKALEASIQEAKVASLKSLAAKQQRDSTLIVAVENHDLLKIN